MKYPTAKIIITHVDGSTDEVVVSLETPPGKYNNDTDITHRVIDLFYNSLDELMQPNN